MISSSVFTDQETNISYITLTNDTLSATFLNFGARWHQFITPDKDGQQENILLSLDTAKSILNDKAQFGALVGPVAGRIKNAKWEDVPLERNLGEHHIHGGSHGWWAQFWTFELLETTNSIKVIFSLTDTSSGYPGPIYVTNTYELTTSSVIMTTEVTSDKKTIINPTNHVYFNLSGNAKRDITKHQLFIKSSHFLETDENNIPSGKLLATKDTGYDFSHERLIADSINEISQGIDDAYLLASSNPQITLSEPLSGRKLSISSNRDAAIIFSTTGFNDDSFSVNKQPMSSELGIAIETQELPDIINHPEWGNIELSPHEKKIFQTTYSIELL